MAAELRFIKNKTMNLLITGAAGHMGGIVIDTLLKTVQPGQISTLTRKPEKDAEFHSKGFNSHLGDYADVASLEKAMAGVDAVLLISAGDQGDRMQEHMNVINTAKKMGVRAIAYTSRSLQDRGTLVNKLMEEHFATEDLIKESGLPYVIFQNALYLETLQYYVGKNVFETGTFMQVAGDGKVAFTLRNDQAEAIGNVLANEAFNNQVYRFTASQACSMYDVAEALTELSGKTITYTPAEVPAYKEMMKKQGLPDAVVNKIVAFNADIKNGQEATVTDDLKAKLGRNPVTLKEGLKTLFNL